MKAKKLELEVDVVGGLGSLTRAEEKALSDFFKKRKKSAIISKSKKTKKGKIAA